jgi:ferredoxin--NADP+ reductase
MAKKPQHYIAIFGAGVAGTEAAFLLAERGIKVALFDQKALPYGKIEEGLPKWHIKLRDQEEANIDKKINHPNIQFVPKTSLGINLDFKEIRKWGFSAICLAIGAWRDRLLPIEGINDYVGKGLYYQNPFVSWYNHHHEPGYSEINYRIEDGAIIIGGGLASLDIAKIVMLETTLSALKNINISINLFELEKWGIGTVLKEYGLTLQNLKLKGCTLFYRKRIFDMPLTDLPQNLSFGKRQKIFQLRERILKNFQNKYLFMVESCAEPIDKIIENNRLVGLVFQRTEIKHGKVKAVPHSEFVVRTPLVISSIGSLPIPLPGIHPQGDLLSVKDKDTGLLDGYDDVFVLGNALTGKGNIRESQKHGKKISKILMEEFLSWEEQEHFELIHLGLEDSYNKTHHIGKLLLKKAPLSAFQMEELNKKIVIQQMKIGYDGNYQNWINRYKPIRLEDLL